MTKWPVQKLAHRATQKQEQHHDATDIKKNHYSSSLVQLRFKIYYINVFTLYIQLKCFRIKHDLKIIFFEHYNALKRTLFIYHCSNKFYL